MTVQSITASDPIDLSAIVPATPTPGPATAPTDPGSSTTSVSGRAQFLSKLQSLEQTDPAQAKQVLTTMADQLRQKAKQGGAHADQMSAMADKLQKAADTGDLSGLQPAPKGGGGGGHHHHHGGGGGHHKAQQAYASQSQSNDPSQTILDALTS